MVFKMGKNKLVSEISKFTKADFDLSKITVELYSGKIASVDLSQVTSAKNTGESISFKTVVGGYEAEFTYKTIEKGVISCCASLTPEAEITDKVKKITLFASKSKYNEKTRLLATMPGCSGQGIHKVCELAEKNTAEYYVSLFSEDNIDLALTLTAKLPSKYKSLMEIEKTDTEICLAATVYIPRSFDGSVFCDEWVISSGMSTKAAFEGNADRYATGETYPAPVGWSSWDYYFTSVTEDDVKENVDFIAADKELSGKIKYIAIDDGWQQREGDWKSGARFPSGLKEMVKYINEKGFEAGIWVAPTRLHYLCGTVMRRHDFLVRDELGDPIHDEDMYVLDPTHPDGERFLRETFTYLADCGFKFYKLDFISNLVRRAESFYDNKAGHYDALKKLISIVRSVVPEGSHIMGCSLPYAIGGGIVNSKRTGWDIHNTWTHVKMTLSAYLPQYASNEKIYRNDIDYLVVRGAQTSSEQDTNVINDKRNFYAANPTSDLRWRDGEDFSYTEAKSWCTAVLMTGSSIFLGDKLTLLNEKGIDLIKKTLKHADFSSATPVFENSGKIPEIWYKSAAGKLYAINFSDEKKEYSVDLSNILENTKGSYCDILTGENYKVSGSKLIFSLDAHDSLCIE